MLLETDWNKLGLYLVMTDPVVGYEECAVAAAGEGVRVIQLRMKNIPVSENIRTAEKVKRSLEDFNCTFIVNDLLEVARAVDADGLHVGQEDMDVDEARRLWGKTGKIIGLSTHGRGQDEAARNTGADYIGVGPVFPTPTKEKPDPALGIEKMSEIIRRSEKPCVAIGGINKDNLREILGAGARVYALVRAVCASSNPAAAVRRLKVIEREFGIG